uniref:PWI domain-containing protein n=1 Tax=Angiostrongylus cantonensis TaxID=6313 RepID=A0A0K0D5Y3_ANGCA
MDGSIRKKLNTQQTVTPRNRITFMIVIISTPETSIEATQRLEMPMIVIATKRGSRSSDYRGSRNAHPQANLSGNLPSLLDFAAPADSVEKARLEREEVNLRIRERELLRREQELLLRQRRLRNRTPPRYGRVMPPRPPRNATFPKTRSLTDGIRRSTNFKRTFKPLKSLPTRLAEKRSTRRSTYVPKKAEKNHRNTAEREFKEVHSDISAKKSAEEEDLFKKLDHDDDVETLIDKVIGTDESYDPSPRSRAVVKLLEFCDKDLLMDEISGKVEALCTGSKPSDINDCTSTGEILLCL